MSCANHYRKVIAAMLIAINAQGKVQEQRWVCNTEIYSRE